MICSGRLMVREKTSLAQGDQTERSACDDLTRQAIRAYNGSRGLGDRFTMK